MWLTLVKQSLVITMSERGVTGTHVVGPYKATSCDLHVRTLVTGTHVVDPSQAASCDLHVRT